jgi:flagellar biosynthesis regulator FlaF
MKSAASDLNVLLSEIESLAAQISTAHIEQRARRRRYQDLLRAARAHRRLNRAQQTRVAVAETKVQSLRRLIEAVIYRQTDEFTMADIAAQIEREDPVRASQLKRSMVTTQLWVLRSNGAVRRVSTEGLPHRYVLTSSQHS